MSVLTNTLKMSSVLHHSSIIAYNSSDGGLTKTSPLLTPPLNIQSLCFNTFPPAGRLLLVHKYLMNSYVLVPIKLDRLYFLLLRESELWQYLIKGSTVQYLSLLSDQSEIVASSLVTFTTSNIH